MNQQDFGLRLKELRKSQALTQSQLASKIGTTRQAYITYETGRCMPSAELIARLSQALGTDLMEMLYSHTSVTFSESKDLITKVGRNDFFTLLEMYSKLSPLSQRRIFALMNILYKGGDKN